VGNIKSSISFASPDVIRRPIGPKVGVSVVDTVSHSNFHLGIGNCTENAQIVYDDEPLASVRSSENEVPV